MSGLEYYFDLGNTRAKFWRCQDGHVEAHSALPHEGSPAKVLMALPSEFDRQPRAIFGISVLGEEVDADFAEAVVNRWGVRPAFARSGRCFGALKSAYLLEPERLGIDRWLGMIASARECEVICVVGCGTAVTIDVVDGMVHLGGYILPGLALMEGALRGGTRKVRYDGGAPASIGLGADTGAAVRNGALAAVVALVEKLVHEHGASRLVLTGGDADIIAAQLAPSCEVDSGLLLKGMLRYFENAHDPHGMGASAKGGE